MRKTKSRIACEVSDLGALSNPACAEVDPTDA